MSGEAQTAAWGAVVSVRFEAKLLAKLDELVKERMARAGQKSKSSWNDGAPQRWYESQSPEGELLSALTGSSNWRSRKICRSSVLQDLVIRRAGELRSTKKKPAKKAKRGKR